MYTVVSHDAGGAEIISSYIRQQNIDCLFVLDGPAKKIFESKLGPTKQENLYAAIQQSEQILCGTSWQSELEFNAIKYARSQSKRSVAFLDHWVNYKERFIRNDEVCLPDEIWVGDAVAETLAKTVFPDIVIKMIDNPYLKEIKQILSNIPIKERLSDEIVVLYVCEPIRDHAFKQYGDQHYWGYTEEEALKYFLTHCNKVHKRISRIVIRPHPSEPREKYRWVQNEFGLPIEIGNQTLLEEIINSDMVVGCQTMAMVVGLLAKKHVICSIPPGGAKCNLPHSEIIHLQSIV
ncbi:MAG: hypothetical protein HY939_02965 [Gammaproteobacteria bacterium]|nr:hypothetical protein [Gammaproteobacteria bacterium]